MKDSMRNHSLYFVVYTSFVLYTFPINSKKCHKVMMDVV